MRKILPLLMLLILLFVPNTYAQRCEADGTELARLMPHVGGGVPAAAACASPTCPTTCAMTATEAFEGGSNACYTSGPTSCINTWASSGSTISIADSPAGASEGTGCTKSVKFVAAGSESYIQWNNGSQINLSTTNVDIVFYLYVNAFAPAAYASRAVCTFTTTTDPFSDYPAKFYLRDDGDTTPTIYAGGDTSTSILDIAFDTWYLVTIHLDTTVANSYMSLAGSTACSGGAADTATCKKFTRYAKNPQYFNFGALSITIGESSTLYFGYLYVSKP